jgi:GDPmannose 4,6-dehydratase
MELEFHGEGLDEKGVCVAGPADLVGKTLVEVSPDFYRPTDVVNLWGDPSKAKRELGWDPQKTTFEQLVKIMVKHDMEKVAADHVASVMRTNLAEFLEKGVVK